LLSSNSTGRPLCCSIMSKTPGFIVAANTACAGLRPSRSCTVHYTHKTLAARRRVLLVETCPHCTWRSPDRGEMNTNEDVNTRKPSARKLGLSATRSSLDHGCSASLCSLEAHWTN
jgi:hypothetical protein